VSFEGSACFAGGLALGDLLRVVVAARAGVALLGDRDAVQSTVELAVAAPGQPVPLDLPGGGFDRGDAGVGGVVGSVGEPGDRPGVAQNPCGGDRPDPLDRGQRGPACFDGLGDPGVVDDQLGVQALEVVEPPASPAPSTPHAANPTTTSP